MNQKHLQDSLLDESLNPILLAGCRQSLSAAAEKGAEALLAAEHQICRFLLQKLAIPYYSIPRDSHPLAFFLSAIHWDGIGDYYALLRSAQALRLKAPNCQVQIAFTHEKTLPIINAADYGLNKNSIHDFVEHRNCPLLEPVLEGRCPPEKPEQVHLYKSLRSSRAIVNISLAINTFENPHFKDKSLYFSEAGNFQGIANSNHYRWYSMGLLPLEEGIFLDRPHPARSGGIVPVIPGPFHIAYLTKSPADQLIFFYLCVLLQKEQSFTIVTPKLSPECLQQLDKEWLLKQQVGELIVREDGEEVRIRIGNAPRTVTVINVFPLPMFEFIRLMEQSGPVIGCTGDLSFFDTLMLGKIPFYESCPHKKETLEGLVLIARFLGAATVVAFLTAKNLPRSPMETAIAMYELLAQHNFETEWQRVLHFIHRYCKLEDHLTGRIMRTLHGGYAHIEEEAVAEIVQGKCTFSEALNRIRQCPK